MKPFQTCYLYTQLILPTMLPPFKHGQHLLIYQIPFQHHYFEKSLPKSPQTEMITIYSESLQHNVNTANTVIIIQCKYFLPCQTIYDCFQDKVLLNYVTTVHTDRQGSQKVISKAVKMMSVLDGFKFIDILMHNLIKQKFLYYEPSFFKLIG